MAGEVATHQRTRIKEGDEMMAWKGESRRHSLARKGIKTAKGSFIIEGGKILEREHDYGFPTRKKAEQRLAEIKKAQEEFWTPERLQAKKETDEAIAKEKAKRILEFKTEVITENSFGIVDDYGLTNNRMEFIEMDDGSKFIQWEVLDDDDGELLDYAEIGIWTKGKKVIDYDGVFELPKQAIILLKKIGYNTKEVEFE